MADNYLLFSTMVPCKTKEEQQWLAAALRESVDEDGEKRAPCEWLLAYEPGKEPGPDPALGSWAVWGVWVYTDEYGDVDRLADIVCRWQDQFDIDEPWSLEYAETCSKPRLDEFCGGAVVCYRGEAHFMHTGLWQADLKKELCGAK